MRFLVLLVLLCGTARAQHDFQVATIKPSAPDEERRTQIRGSRFATTGTTLVDLLVYAYNVHPSQVVGGPEWMHTTKFDVLADPELETRPTSDAMKAMVGRLVVERFHLVLRRETRELAVYALVRTGKPVTLKKSDNPEANFPTGGFDAPGTLVVRNGTLANFAAFVQRFSATEVNRPVVDQTGIAGRYDFDLHYTPGSAREPERSGPPGIFTAIQEQMGLKLEATRAPVEVLRVESVTMPTQD